MAIHRPAAAGEAAEGIHLPVAEAAAHHRRPSSGSAAEAVNSRRRCSAAEAARRVPGAAEEDSRSWTWSAGGNVRRRCSRRVRPAARVRYSRTARAASIPAPRGAGEDETGRPRVVSATRHPYTAAISRSRSTRSPDGPMTPSRSLGAALAALAVASGARAQAAAPARPASTFDLSIASIMRGPLLVGRSPDEVRWSADSRTVWYRWHDPEARDTTTHLYRVAAAGGAPVLVSDSEAYWSAPAEGAGRWNAVISVLHIERFPAGIVRPCPALCPDQPVAGRAGAGHADRTEQIIAQRLVITLAG